MTFKELNLVAPLLQALDTQGYIKPTPIQAEAIPVILSRKDLVGVAQTGTGKTAAFALPILQLMSEERHAKRIPGHPRCLILTPTRELAIQIQESFQDYGQFLSVKHTVIFGGVNQGPQTHALRSGMDVLVATPGRLLDLMQQGYIDLKNLEIFVLDEADRMLDMGFIHDVKKVVAKLPARRQTLFFSATMPDEVQRLAQGLLHQPEKVEVTPVSSAAETVAQSVYFVDKKDKRQLLAFLLKEKKTENAIVFSRTKHGADRIAKDLSRAGIHAESIHGDKSQNARQRALSNFKSGASRILVATDIAARGIDVEALSLVVNFDLPEVPETYVHRIGRTGRAGATGSAISFCDTEEKDYLKGIQKLINKSLTVVNEHPFPASDSGLVQIRLPKGKDVVSRPDAVVMNRPPKRKFHQHGGKRAQDTRK